MLQPGIRRNLLIGALGLVSAATSASALPAGGAGGDTIHVAMSTGEPVTGVEREMPVAWNVDDRAGVGEFTEMALSDNGVQPGLPEGSAFMSLVVLSPIVETQSEEKVPEPVTLVLVGTGLIAIASSSRRKKPRWKFSRVSAARIRYWLAREV